MIISQNSKKGNTFILQMLQGYATILLRSCPSDQVGVIFQKGGGLMRHIFRGVVCLALILLCVVTAFGAVPEGTGVIKSPGAVSGREFTSKSSIAQKLDSMFAGNIGLYVDKEKTVLVNAALGTENVPNNGKYQYWGNGHAGTSCFAYANAFYATFYDGQSPHDPVNSNHQRVKASGKITYQNFVKWGVRDDAIVYIREGNHSFLVLHYNENYLITLDGNGDGKGTIALRKQTWQKSSGSNIYNQTPSLIVQPKTGYFAAGSMGMKPPKTCTEGGEYHSWDEGTVTKQPNCNEKGEKTYTCTACGKTNLEVLAKTSNHTYGEWTVTQAATCTQKGKQVRACTVCQKEESKKIAALGHEYGAYTVTRKMTLSTPGLKERSCSRCSKVQTVEIPCTTKNKELGITLKLPEKAFSKEASVEILQLMPEEPAYAAIENALGNLTGKFNAYNIYAEENGAQVQPEGTVQLELTKPKDFGKNLALYAIYLDGTIQQLEAKLSKNGKTLSCELQQFTFLALCDLDVPKPLPPVEETEPATEPETQPETEPTEPETQPALEEPTVPETEPAPQPAAEPARELVPAMGMVAVATAELFLRFVISLIVLFTLTAKEKKKREASIETEKSAV